GFMNNTKVRLKRLAPLARLLENGPQPLRVIAMDAGNEIPVPRLDGSRLITEDTVHLIGPFMFPVDVIVGPVADMRNLLRRLKLRTVFLERHLALADIGDVVADRDRAARLHFRLRQAEYPPIEEFLLNRRAGIAMRRDALADPFLFPPRGNVGNELRFNRTAHQLLE